MHFLRQLLHSLLLAFHVRRSPPAARPLLPPRLRRSPLWTIRRTEVRHDPVKSERSVPPPPPGGWQGIGDPGYLLAEIEELRDLADHAGLRTLAQRLEQAAEEARYQIAERQRIERKRLR